MTTLLAGIRTLKAKLIRDGAMEDGTREARHPHPTTFVDLRIAHLAEFP